jgi:predicted acylesterase/phospholipase RssA
MLHEDELSSSHPPANHIAPTTTTTIVRNKLGDLSLPTLHIGTTRSVNGEFKLFSFPAHKPMLFRTISSSWNTDYIMKCVEASCHIPQAFHPFDIFNRRSLSYPEGDGVLIDGSYYVDGAISCPAPPPTPYDKEDDCFHISVSPISGGKKADHLERKARISPTDESFSFLPLDVTLRGGFKVKPSMQNLRALRVSVGAASSEELQYWFERGLEDGERFVKDWTKAVL